ncbi:hypothetical protein ACI6PS_02635 [Flavobacterium sp. PLA-1-15]|uniref:hypothetical protein n=1 Tax=Flavobacterium sp. PLA-1-15 TaxID=3380533 RepID=UPI003B7FE0C1
MSYNKYQVNNIFAEPRLNAISDFIIEKLMEKFPKSEDEEFNENILEGFILSGKASAILQGDLGSINNVVFVTNKTQIYNWLIENIGKVLRCKQISFKKRILFYPHPDLYFEVWLMETDLEIIPINEINIQILSQIPIETL